MDTMSPAASLEKIVNTKKKERHAFKQKKGIFSAITKIATPNWHGDIDFKFQSHDRVIIGEIKTVNDGIWNPAQLPLDIEQAKQYAALVDIVDNYGRKQEVYLMEEHIFSNIKRDDYVVMVPFKKPNNTEKNPIDLLDMDRAVCLFLEGKCENGFNQITNWFMGLNIGKKTSYPLMCLG